MNVVFYKIKISQGTGAVLGLNRVKNLVDPTTAYLMFGDKCNNNCEFCSQSEGETRLSRVMWPEFDIYTFVQAFNKKGYKFKNICIQVTKSEKTSIMTLNIIKYLRDNIKFNININVSIDLMNYPELMYKFIECGVNRIGIAIDVASEKEFFFIKHKNFKKNIEFLYESVEKFPDRISAHLIIGLGETSYELFSLINSFLLKQINVSLFAYTPIKKKGYLEEKKSPDIKYYRLCQAIFYLLKKKEIEFNDIVFDENNFVKKVNYKKIPGILGDGEFFRTSGCEGCNRPFYNEKVTGDWYNFPRKPKDNEIHEEIKRINEFFI
ncbi:MAG: hypothetical protein M0R46_07250 [Candidatus Muirbacterium halophilum]|nr:hypothetical protein [Candidatus Muirbacterium halophilum]MCK9475696.1 hypothetical protein [Candidatus Muirbacterium halophilum]